MKKHIFLMRHAKAEKSGAYFSDFERPLCPKGKEDAKNAGIFLSKLENPPQKLFFSPSLRTVQTFELINESLRDKIPISESSDLLYSKGSEGYLKLIAKIEPSINSIMVIGHNPDIEEVCSLVCGKTGAFLDFHPASVCLIEIELKIWENLYSGRGNLLWLLNADLLKIS